MLRSLLTPARLVMAVFFMQAVLIANWYPRIPDVAAKIGGGPGDLAIGLLGMPVGTFLALTAIGPLVQRFSARRLILAGFVVYSVSMALPGWAWNVPSLFVAMLFLGASYPIVDVSMNVEAALIQDGLGRRIMNTCHGFWSIGSMVGAVIGAGFAQIALDTRWHLLIVAIVALPVGLAVGNALPARVSGPQAGEPRQPAFALPSVGMIGLCLLGFGMIMVEGGARNWGAVYLRDVLGASPGAAGIGFAIFMLAMAIGRFAGDRLADRYGPVIVARLCCILAFVGIVIVVVARNYVEAAVGLAAEGLGVSVIYPLAVTAAAARGDRPAPINVAALSLIAYSSALVGPPLVGFVADAAGLRVGLAMLLPTALLSTLLAGELKRRPPAAAEST